MPTRDELRAELTTGPLAGQTGPMFLGTGGALANDQKCADLLNAKTVDGRRRAPLADVKRHAIENGYWIPLKVAAASHVNAGVQGAAQAALDYVGDLRFDTIDLDLPSVGTMLGALVSGGVITTAQRDGLLVLGNSKISRAEEAWGAGTIITAEQVGAAR